MTESMHVVMKQPCLKNCRNLKNTTSGREKKIKKPQLSVEGLQTHMNRLSDVLMEVWIARTKHAPLNRWISGTVKSMGKVGFYKVGL